MRWTKIPGNMLHDERMLELIERLGFEGLGIYLTVRLQVECIGEGYMPLDQVIAAFGKRTRRQKILSVINDYGLFTLSDFLVVSCAPYQPTTIADAGTDAGAGTGADTGVGTGVGTIADAGETHAGTEKREEKRRDERMVLRFRKPSLSEIEKYCRERNNGIDPQRFYDYQEACGWMVGKKKMRDWKAAVRTWERLSQKVGRQAADGQTVLQTTCKVVDGVQYYNGMPLPEDAPPRPSDNAHWDFATDSWSEFY